MPIGIGIGFGFTGGQGQGWVAPEALGDFTASADWAGQNRLAFTFPGSDVSAVYLRYNVDQTVPPATYTAGLPVPNNSAGVAGIFTATASAACVVVHSGRTFGAVYRYAAFAYNGVPSDPSTSVCSGTFNPFVYGAGNLKSYLDARRLTGVASGAGVTTPIDYATNQHSMTQATAAKRPAFVPNATPAGRGAYDFYPGSVNMWAGAVAHEYHSNLRGLTVAALAANLFPGSQAYLVDVWEDGTPGRAWYFRSAPGGAGGLNISEDGSGTAQQAATVGWSTTSWMAMLGTWQPASYSAGYNNGALVNSNGTAITDIGSVGSVLRVGTYRNTTAFPFQGQCSVIVLYGEHMESMNALMLTADLKAQEAV